STTPSRRLQRAWLRSAGSKLCAVAMACRSVLARCNSHWGTRQWPASSSGRSLRLRLNATSPGSKPRSPPTYGASLSVPDCSHRMPLCRYRHERAMASSPSQEGSKMPATGKDASVVIVPSDQLTGFVARIFEANGSSEAEAQAIAQYLVASNLTGHESHGVARVPRYVGYVKDGQVRS